MSRALRRADLCLAASRDAIIIARCRRYGGVGHLGRNQRESHCLIGGALGSGAAGLEKESAIRLWPGRGPRLPAAARARTVRRGRQSNGRLRQSRLPVPRWPESRMPRQLDPDLVTLGAELFHHLGELPLAWAGSRGNSQTALPKTEPRVLVDPASWQPPQSPLPTSRSALIPKAGACARTKLASSSTLRPHSRGSLLPAVALPGQNICRGGQKLRALRGSERRNHTVAQKRTNEIRETDPPSASRLNGSAARIQFRTRRFETNGGGQCFERARAESDARTPDSAAPGGH